MTDELIKIIAQSSKINEYIHLPLQSGNNAILKKMNRQYTAQNYLTIIQKIQQAFQKYKPKISLSITTDLIVGFPGETEKQFQDSLKIFQQVQFDMAYISQFSPRPGTAAWKMKDDVSALEKKKREKKITEILKKSAFQKNKALVGKTESVLIEKFKNGFLFGKTRSFKNVKIKPNQALILKNSQHYIGSLIDVLIEKAQTWNLEGKLKK
jgi:tRNA-2-methylthio-N6-dimethylallyladenosine synthase